jgi:hypothetical protein
MTSNISMVCPNCAASLGVNVDDIVWLGVPPRTETLANGTGAKLEQTANAWQHRFEDLHRVCFEKSFRARIAHLASRGF